MTPTPTSAERAVRTDGFGTLVEALNFAAQGETGVNIYSLRGELVEAIPYALLSREARAIALRLLAAGLRPGDRVGLAAETDGDFIRAFFGCQYAGLIAAPLPLPAPLGGRPAYVEQIGRMLVAAGASAVLGPPTLVGWLKEAGGGLDLRFAGALSELPAEQGGELSSPNPDQPAYLQFSSGSTRFPKGVTIAHRAVMANAEAITRHGLRVTATDRAVSWLPLYHDMGLVGFLLSPVASQMSVDLLPTSAFVRRPLLWLDLISRGGTIAYSPTFGYELCTRRSGIAALESLDLSHWRVAGVGGDMIRTAPLEQFAERFKERGFRREAIVASYGMAEATLAITMAPLGRGLASDELDVDRLERDGVAASPGPGARTRRFARCGVALPGHELQVRNPEGEVAADRQVHRVFARGPSIMSGYWGDAEETAMGLSADGWLDTGDLGYLADGELVLTGRAKDLMILNGRNIWPQDLEWAAETEIPALRSGDVAVVAVPGADEDAIVALVQCRESEPALRLKLVEDVKALLRSRHSVEVVVELVGSHALPRTSSGKLSRVAARRLYLDGALMRVAEPV